MLLGTAYSNNRLSTTVAMCELGIKPITALAAKARIRGLSKWQTSGTWLADLLKGPVISRTWRWSSMQMLSRLATKANLERDEVYSWFEAENRFEIHLPGWAVGHWYNTWAMESCSALSWKRYEEFGFGGTARRLRDLEVQYPDLSYGFTWLHRARCGSIWTAKMAADARLIPRDLSDSCLSCGETLEDTSYDAVLWHWLMECSEFDEIREELEWHSVTQVMEDLLADVGASTTVNKLSYLLGGAPNAAGPLELLEYWSGLVLSVQRGSAISEPVDLRRYGDWKLHRVCYMATQIPWTGGKPLAVLTAEIFGRIAGRAQQAIWRCRLDSE